MDNLNLTILYDYYGTLLTEKQQLYFEDYYFNNLTLQEIADNNNVSKNLVSKTLKTINNKLLEYEKKLKLNNNRLKIEKIIINLDEKIKEKIKELI